MENIVNSGHLALEARDRIKEALLRRHRHQHERRHDKVDKGSRLPLIRSLADIGRNSSKNVFGSSSKYKLTIYYMPTEKYNYKLSTGLCNLSQKIPK